MKAKIARRAQHLYPYGLLALTVFLAACEQLEF